MKFESCYHRSKLLPWKQYLHAFAMGQWTFWLDHKHSRFLQRMWSSRWYVALYCFVRCLIRLRKDCGWLHRVHCGCTWALLQSTLCQLTLTVLNFWNFTSYCSSKHLWSGMGEVVPARTSPTLHPPSPPTVHQDVPHFSQDFPATCSATNKQKNRKS